MADKIIVLIEDDWELRGNGLGDVESLQHKPAMFLLEQSKILGMKVTFMAETMQQLRLRSYLQRVPALQKQIDMWDWTLCEIKEQGHDVQLHLHPQWHEAPYRDGYFFLNKKWNIASYDAFDRTKMIRAGIDYLENLLRPLDAHYHVHSFKAGSWGLQPSKDVMGELETFGIRIVMGPGKGIAYESEDFYADYNDIEDPHMPYYPKYDQVEKVSTKEEQIVVLPLPYYSLGVNGARIKLKKKLGSKSASKKGMKEDAPEEIKSLAPMIPKKDGILQAMTGDRTFDIGNACFEELKLGLDQVMERTLRLNAEVVPLVLQSHTKCYPGNEKDLAQFFHYLVKSYGHVIEFQTLTEFLSMLPKLQIVRK
jgi:hypothetical protein